MAEFIREKALYILDKEIPHGIAVLIDTFTERTDRDLIDINATIVCEKASHKPIILGKQGRTIRRSAPRRGRRSSALWGCRST